MNLPESAFSFGKIVKVFLPGLIYTVALAYGLYIYNTIDVLFTGHDINIFSTLKKQIDSQPSATTIVLVSLSVILGLVSNILLYTRNDKVLREPFASDKDDKNKTAIIETEEKVKEYILSNLIPKGLTLKNKNIFDVESFLLPYIDLVKYNFILESYWYFLEFIRNFNAAILTLSILLLFDTFIVAITYIFTPISVSCGERILFIIPGIALIFLRYKLQKAIIKNYISHRKKILSLQISTIEKINRDSKLKK